MSECKVTRITAVRLAAALLVACASHAALADDPALPNNDGADGVLRVCADPNNMPLSNNKGEGYENKIASQMASDFGLQARIHVLSAAHGLRAAHAARQGARHRTVQVRPDYRRAEGLRPDGDHAAVPAFHLRDGVPEPPRVREHPDAVRPD